MLRYKISSLTKRAKGSVTYLPPIPAPSGVQARYEQALNLMLRQIAAAVRADVLPTYTLDTMVRDVDAGTFQRLKELAVTLARVAASTVARILDLDKSRHTADFMRGAKRAIGVDISAVLREGDLAEYMRLATQRNTGLIVSLSEDVVKNVEQVVLRNKVAGASVKTLRKELTDQFGLSENRAQLIARDQTAKFNSDLNRIRQEQAEIKEYDWDTSGDERVRPRHARLDGKTYRWGQATEAEGGLPPGQPIQCRCVARAKIVW